MDEEFNPDDLRPIPYRPDTEVMLGPWMMGGLLFGLILLCVIFFSLGYTMGKHGAHSSFIYRAAKERSSLAADCRIRRQALSHPAGQQPCAARREQLAGH